MEYETKCWLVRWNHWFRDGIPHITYTKQFKDPFKALKRYRKLVEKDVLSAKLIRADIKNQEHIVGSLEKAVPVTYTQEYITKYKWEK
jgi:hypothetical protein